MEFDPAKIPCPDFTSDTYVFLRNALLADANAPEISTDELAAQCLKEQWQAHIDGLQTQYQARLQETENLREERRLAAEEAERHEKEKELAKEAEKKRVFPFTASPKELLSWSQVMRAKSTFLNALHLGTYPSDFIAMFATFYTNMDIHRELREQDGEKVMAYYHAEMRLAWYDAMERGEPFDLSVIAEPVLGESR
ncbi:hypothetical protein EV368DRAFT_70136 [Lentinula lateritia]|nr:hypothetical protein EV368DRAFT_70136 [Lentinula lateritia]